MDYLARFDKIPNIEGGYYGKPRRVIAYSGAYPDIITIEYEDGHIATGLILTGEESARFDKKAKMWRASQAKKKRNG